MQMTNILKCSLALVVLPGAAAWAEESEQVTAVSGLEVVVVTGVRLDDGLSLHSSQVARAALDNSALMRQFPGGNRNANGPLTNISQYRGMFGAQNSVLVDGAAYSADCPNWMDSPLSSIPQALTGSVTLHRGLGSVKNVQEGLGVGIEIHSKTADFSTEETWSAFGNAEAGYGANNSAWNASVFSGFHDANHWVSVAASRDTGDDYEFGGGTVRASRFDRDQYRLGYGQRFGETELALKAAINRTGEAGVPGLPMDMRYLDSEQYDIELKTPVGPGALTLSYNRLTVDHIMDNFTLRPVPLNGMGKPTYRESQPIGDTDAAKLFYSFQWQGADVELGFDSKWEVHDHPLDDPTNEAFHISNFNDIDRDRSGLFANATREAGNWDLEAGMRYNRVKMDAGQVGGSLGIPPMSPMYRQQERLDELAAEFNAQDRRKTDDQWVGLFRASRHLGAETRLNLGLGRKARSPSYQERYLWLPMSSTAGLADGRVYIGDIGLEPETSIELTAGLDWFPAGIKLTPELFYRDVDGFIQGVPSSNETANTFAIASTGKPPLQYANVDAELYGFDLGYEWEVSENVMLRGTLSYVRGKRTDEKDDLYRIAPLSSYIELSYNRADWFVAAESVAAARQDRVASYNGEMETAGWGILSLRAGWQFAGSYTLGAGVENLFDRDYRDHLASFNRVRESDIPVGERIAGMGRNVYLKLNASW